MSAQVRKKLRKMAEVASLIAKIKTCSALGDLCGVLDVLPSVDLREIKRAYHFLCRRLHPDRCDCPGAVEAFQTIIFSAYTELSGQSPDERVVADVRRRACAQDATFVKVVPHSNERLFHLRCMQGHDYGISFHVLERGGKCPICVQTDNEIQTLIAKCGHKSLVCRRGTLYRIRCAKTHDFVTTIEDMRMGGACPLCAFDQMRVFVCDPKNMATKRKRDQ